MHQRSHRSIVFVVLAGEAQSKSSHAGPPLPALARRWDTSPVIAITETASILHQLFSAEVLCRAAMLRCKRRMAQARYCHSRNGTSRGRQQKQSLWADRSAIQLLPPMII